VADAIAVLRPQRVGGPPIKEAIANGEGFLADPG
jgi:hypothetical protein